MCVYGAGEGMGGQVTIANYRTPTPNIAILTELCTVS